MAGKLKTVRIRLTPQIADLLEAEVAAGRFANLSEAIRNAAWKAFAEDPAADFIVSLIPQPGAARFLRSKAQPTFL